MRGRNRVRKSMRNEGCHLSVQISIETSKAVIAVNGTSTPEHGVTRSLGVDSQSHPRSNAGAGRRAQSVPA
jgi:hypothetical protein